MTRHLLLITLLLTAEAAHSQTAADSPRRASKVDPVFLAEHDAALRRAKVWFAPSVPVGSANLGTTAMTPDGFAADAVVNCRFKIEGVAGSTPKFVCALPNGDDFKVKYGRDNAEVYTEVVATRLLNALGFPADRMYPVAQVRCQGCSSDPFKDLQCLNEGLSKEQCFPRVDYNHVEVFDGAVIERTFKGRRIETRKERGWSWKELTKIDPAAGGATRAEVDGLRLLAVFLGHWDNKAKNQRLLCQGEKDVEESTKQGPLPCAHPVAMVQDVGATFGPDKLNLEKWAATPIWSDAASCSVSMRALPYGGSTFADARISEEGRTFLGKLLSQLTGEQVRALFEGARISAYPHATARGRTVEAWATAFQQKVDAIANRPACALPAR